MNKELIMKLGEEYGDPYRCLYFEKDTENGGAGEVLIPGGWVQTYDCYWDREKSNECIDKFGFSFYLGLQVFNGYCRHVPGEKGSELYYYRVFGHFFGNKDTGSVCLYMSHSVDIDWDSVRCSFGYEVSNEFGNKYVVPYTQKIRDIFGSLYVTKKMKDDYISKFGKESYSELVRPSDPVPDEYKGVFNG